MSLLNRLFKRSSKGQARMFVLGLEGFPLSLARILVKEGTMPNLSALWHEGSVNALEGVLPADSTVSWACYATGQNPGRHGIFGLVDRQPNPFRAYLPTAVDLQSQTIWEMMGRQGRQVGAMNVPLTYPPKIVHGFMVGCFLTPELDLAKGVFPADLAARLMEMGYRIEADSYLAKTDLNAYLADLEATMTRRFHAALQLMRRESWDLFQLHESACDRLHHFCWDLMDDVDLKPLLRKFYRRLDDLLGEINANLPPDSGFMILSDHGFARCRGLIMVNHWLEQNGYLLFGRGKKKFDTMRPETKAYSMLPGRIFINLEGREERGSVPRGHAYEDLRAELIHRLSGLCDPYTHEPLIRRAHKREELYAGPQLNRAADIILEPMPGYDLRSNLDAPDVLMAPDQGGAHIPGDAVLYIKNQTPHLEAPAAMSDMVPTILAQLNMSTPPGLDGRNLL